LVGLITLANAQPIPPNLVNQCINIRLVGTTLEVSCVKNLVGYGGSEGGYQFSSLVNANICIDYIQNNVGFLVCGLPDYAPPSIPGSICDSPPWALPPGAQQEMGC
jgi:hypothetical protein